MKNENPEDVTLKAFDALSSVDRRKICRYLNAYDIRTMESYRKKLLDLVHEIDVEIASTRKWIIKLNTEAQVESGEPS